MPEHKEYFKGSLYVYSSETLDGLATAVTRGRAAQGRRANYNNVWNELTMKAALEEKRPGVQVRSRLTNKAEGPKAQARKILKEECPKLTAQSAFSAARSLLNDARGKVVSQAEITRRASICASCPKRGTLKGCVPCGVMARFKEYLNQARTKLWGTGYVIPKEVASLTCGVCCCDIPAMLPAPLTDFKDEAAAVTAKRPENCWLLEKN